MPLSTQQRTKVKQFSSCTEATAAVAETYLKKTGWIVEAAVAEFYENPPARGGGKSVPAVSPEAASAFFETYAGGEAQIYGEAIATLCTDAGEDPMGDGILLLHWVFKADSMGILPRDAFLAGCMEHGVSSAATLKDRFPAIRAEVASSFDKYYNYVYTLGKEEGQKSVQVPQACALWGLVLKGRFKLLDSWLEFIQETTKNAISRDTWAQLLDFAVQVDDDLDKFDENGAWPVLVDEFVDWLKAKK